MDDFDLIDHSDLHILDFSKYTYSQSAPIIRSLSVDNDILFSALTISLSPIPPLKALV